MKRRSRRSRRARPAVSVLARPVGAEGTPKDAIAKLNTAVVDALSDANVRQRLNDVGHEIPPREQQTPEALAAYHKAGIAKWTPIIKAENIKEPKRPATINLRSTTSPTFS